MSLTMSIHEESQPINAVTLGRTRYYETIVELQSRLQDKLDITKIKLEKASFMKMKQKLMQDQNLKGKFVAIHNGNIVDYDDDDVKLMKRMYDKYSHTPILIEKVADEPKVIIHSPRANVY